MKCSKRECKVCKEVRMPYDDFQSLSFIPDPEPSENGNIKFKLLNIFTRLIYLKF